jgi:hypothetical protein
MTTATLGGGIAGPRIRGEERQRWLEHARAWRVRMKPHFDALDRAGAFSDSPARRPILREAAE